MAEFVVNTSQMKSYANQISALQRDLDAVAVKLGAMQLGSVLRIKASTALVGKIADCKWAAAHQSDNLGRLARGLEDIAELYENCEKNLADPKTQAQAEAQAQAQAQAQGNASEKGYEFKWPNIIEWLGKKSVPFSLISALSGFMKGDAKGIVSGLKNLTYAIGNGTKAIFNPAGGVNADWASKLFGFAGHGVGGLKDSWQKTWEGLRLSKQTNWVGKTATVCKWAGYALTFVADGIDNYNEFDGDMGARFWGETIVEGAVDVGLSIGAGVLIAAALPASAPAIVVGAAAAGVVWAANEACEWITGGRDIAEVIGDAVCDGAEWVGRTAQNIGEAAREAGKNIAEGAKNAWNSTCKWVGGLFG